MSVKKVIILCILSFTIGVVVGLVFLKYLLPNLSSVEQNLREEDIYEVEHNACPVEQETKSEECSLYIDMSGALNNPGVYCLFPGNLVIDAVKKAGGFNSHIAMEYLQRSINLAAPLVNNQKLYFPSSQELLCELKEFTLKKEEIIPVEVQEENPIQTDPPEGTTCININTANITQLDSLEGIGPSTAQKIIDNRPYNNIEELLNVSGIGEATFNKFKDNICI